MLQQFEVLQRSTLLIKTRLQDSAAGLGSTEMCGPTKILQPTLMWINLGVRITDKTFRHMPNQTRVILFALHCLLEKTMHRECSIKVRLPPTSPSTSKDDNVPVTQPTPTTPPRNTPKKTVRFVESTPATTIASCNTSPSSTHFPSPAMTAEEIPFYQSRGVSITSDTSTSLPSTFFSSIPSRYPYKSFPFSCFLQSILMSNKGLIDRYPFDPDPLATVERIIHWRFTETVLGFLIQVLDTCTGLGVLGRLQVLFLMSYASKSLLVRIACVLSVAKDPSERTYWSEHTYWFERFVDAMEARLKGCGSEFEEFAQEELDQLETAFVEKFPSQSDSNMRSNVNIVINPHPCRVEWTDWEEIVASRERSDIPSKDENFWT